MPTEGEPMIDPVGGLGHGVCWGREAMPAENTIYEETLVMIRDQRSVCAEVYYDEEGNELLKITCHEDKPVIYRVCEMDLQSCTYTLRFPD